MRIEGLVKEDFLRKVEKLRGGSGALDEAARRVEAREEDPISRRPRPVGPHRPQAPPAPRPVLPSSPSKKSSLLLLSLVSRISHLGISVPSLEQGGKFWDLLGLVEEHREEVASQKVVTSFRAVGRVPPRAPRADVARTARSRRRSTKRGPGIHHLCLEVADVRAALGRLKAAGVRLVNEEPIDGAHDCLVAFVHPSATGGILLELSEKKKKG